MYFPPAAIASSPMVKAPVAPPSTVVPASLEIKVPFSASMYNPAKQSIPPSPVMSPLALSGRPQSQTPFLVLSLSNGHSSLQSGVPSRSLSVVQSSPPAPPLPDMPALPLPPLPPVVPPVPTKLPALPEPLVPLVMSVVDDDPPVPIEPPAAEASFLLTTPGSSAEQP